MTAATTLHHDALPYVGPQNFTTAALGVVRAAIAHDAVPVVFASPAQIGEVRTALGSSARNVIGFDMSVAGRNPARLLPALQRFMDDHPDRLVWCVAEPVRHNDPAPVVLEVELHELLLRLPAFHSWNCRLTCTYDVQTLSPNVVARLEAAHHAPRSDAVEQVERARAEPLPPRPTSSDELGVDRTTLGALRGFVHDRAEKAGLDDERVDDLVYAVNEAVTNSICHGEGRAQVSFWIEHSSVVCEVRDRGWIRDPLAGRIAPGPDLAKGRGLWLVNQLCDLVQLRSSATGTTLRLHVDAPRSARFAS